MRQTTMIAIILSTAFFVCLTSGNIRLDASNNKDGKLLAVAISPNAWRLFNDYMHLIEDPIRSLSLPYMSGTIETIEWNVKNGYVADFEILSFSFEDMSDGVRVKRATACHLLNVFSAKFYKSSGSPVPKKSCNQCLRSSPQSKAYSDDATLDLRMRWNDFKLYPKDLNMSWNIKILLYNGLGSLDKYMRIVYHIARENAATPIRHVVRSLIYQTLNPFLQRVKQYLRSSNFSTIIDFENDVNVRCDVQKRYLRIVFTPKSAKPPAEVQKPFSRMFCIDADLREILFAALSPKQKKFMDARQSTVHFDYSCVAPEFMCEGLYCQFCSDLKRIAEANNSSQSIITFYDCLSFE